MPAPARRFEAIVVGRNDLGEADRVVRLLTAEAGCVSALARGARRPGRRFAGALDPGNRVEAMLRPGRGELWHLDGAELLDGRAHLRADLERIALAGYACELVSALARAEQAEPRLYALLEVALGVMDAATGPPAAAFRLGLEAKALTFAGLTPVLDRCAACGEPPGDEALAFDPGAGGVVHRRCGAGAAICAAEASALERARRTPLVDLLDTPAPDGDRWRLYTLVEWHLGRRLRAQALLAELEGAG